MIPVMELIDSDVFNASGPSSIAGYLQFRFGEFSHTFSHVSRLALSTPDKLPPKRPVVDKPKMKKYQLRAYVFQVDQFMYSF